MGETTALLLAVASLVLALGVCWKPLGDYMAAVFISPRHTRIERGLYRVMGVDPEGDQTWASYARSVLAFSMVSVGGLYALLRLQTHLPLSIGRPVVSPSQAFETAASFVTNTNWQSYSGEVLMSHLSQMAGLAVQNFLSAAVGLAVAVAFHALGDGLVLDDSGGEVELVPESLEAVEPPLGAARTQDAGGLVDDLLPYVGVGPVAGGAQQVVDHGIAERAPVLDRRGDRVGAFGLEELGRVESVGQFEVGGVEVGGGEVPERLAG